MNLHLTGRHLEITPAIRDYATGKFGKIKRHFDHVIDVNIILSVEKLKQKAEEPCTLAAKMCLWNAMTKICTRLLMRW